MLAAGGIGGGGGGDGGGSYIIAGSGQTQQVTKIRRRFKNVEIVVNEFELIKEKRTKNCLWSVTQDKKL